MEVYEACKPGKAKISAVDLPQGVDEDRCPVAGRVIADSTGIGTHLPLPGWGIFVETYSPDEPQEFEVQPTRSIYLLTGSIAPPAATGTA
jgi:hypothetical protein